MAKSYRHLAYEERCQIYILKERGDSPAQISRILDVHPSTITRELNRNGGSQGYQYELAHQKAQDRRKKSHCRKMTPEMILSVEGKLKMDLSPVQISGRLKREGKCSVGHETIYKHIWADKKKGGALYKHLRRSGKKYNRRSKGTAGRGCIPGRIDIKERPEIVEKKTRPGDWELDTIISAGQQGAIVSMVERATKLTKLMKVPCKTAQEVTEALIKKLGPIQEFVLTLTSDNGKEFAYHQSVSKALEADFYFATPYHSWERGLNEHTNGLVRQYFPKSMNFDDITQEDVERVERLLNNRPRKILEFETPLEAFSRMTGRCAL
ncbi:MAG: IS30 family transposase [Chlamydiae bacterium]|nr:IS30 family transposase [Chlamydiota bacterium]